MCIFQPFTDELHSCSYVRRSTVTGFRKRCFVLVHSEVCCGAVRFFEYAANSRLCREGETSLAGRNRWHYSTEWKLRFIQNVASCYVLCLKIESVNTGSCARVCLCATQRSEWYECTWNTKWRRVRIEFPPGPDLDRSPVFEKRWCIVYT